jgi:hypothetical protein
VRGLGAHVLLAQRSERGPLKPCVTSSTLVRGTSLRSSTEERRVSTPVVARSSRVGGSFIVACFTMRTCPRCSGPNETTQSTCRDCYNEYMRGYLNKRWQQRRAWGIELLGGKCVDCGGTSDLQFDHIDPATKEFTLSSKPFCSKDQFLRELVKCVLRCTDPCHKNRSAEQRRIPHGGGTGRRDCACELCRNRRSEYMREYNRTRRRRLSGRAPDF